MSPAPARCLPAVRSLVPAVAATFALALAAHATAQSTHSAGAHASHRQAASGDPSETAPAAPPTFVPALGGEYAFASLAEIANALRADPDTDWSEVDLPALREHLRDMSRVMLDAEVETEPTALGATFLVTSDDPAVAGSIVRMTRDHAAATMSGHGEIAPWTFGATPVEGGARVTVASEEEGVAAMIRALGFHGVLADGDHHRRHHLMIATGADPH